LIPLSGISQSNLTSVERFTLDDGLKNITILDITQDHKGYIWIAVEDGLIRYDGYEFKSYGNIPGDTTSLSENRVEKLFFSQDSTLWIGMPRSLNKYVPDCDCFHRYDENTSPSFPKDAGQINAFAEDQQRNLWIGTQNGGLFKYDKKNQRFSSYLNDTLLSDHLLGDQVRVLLGDSNNNLWIGTGEPFDDAISGGGLLRFNLNTNEITRFLHRPGDINSLVDNRVSALLEDNEGKIWIGTCENGLHYFDPLTQTLIRMMPDENNLTGIYAPQGEMGLWTSCPHVRVIHQDEAGGFWIGTYNAGLHYFEPKTNKLTRFIPNSLDPSALSSNAVWSFLYDNQGRVWVGCLPGGLHKIDFSLKKFQIYEHQPGDENSLSSSNILSIYGTKEKPDQLWIGTRGGGLIFLDLETNQFGSYRHNPGNSYSINNDIVWITYEDSQGTFWVGTESGLQIFDRKTGRFSDYEIYKNGSLKKITDPILRILEDKSGNLWLGTWSEGLIKLDRKNKTFKRYQFSEGSQQTFYNSVFSIYQDSLGKIWAGVFQSGLFQYDVENDLFIQRIKDQGAVSIIEESQGLLLVGTPHSGLLYYGISDGSIQQYTMDDGLPSNGIFSIEKDGTGNYWLATGRGISYFNRDTEEFINYGLADGLTVSNFNFSNGYQTPDGNIFFAGEGGVARFHPNKINGNPYPPKVLIKSPFINNNIFDSDSNKFSISDLAKLSYDQNDITFNYVGIHFTIPEKNQYRYKLEPYDKDWINAGTQRSIRYTNLDPGTYNFLVTASNSDGVWNDNSASVLIVIKPPWWNTWWAYVIFFLLVGGITYWFYRFQLSRKLAMAESRRLKDIDAMKSSLYTNITHEFRTPLTIIMGMLDNLKSSQLSKENISNVGLIEKNSKKLLKLVNDILGLAKLENSNILLNLTHDNVITIISYCVESMKSLAGSKTIDLVLYQEKDEILMDYDPDRLSTIMTNLISNAIKFTPEGGRVFVHANQKIVDNEETLVVKVKDNGFGIPPEDLPHIFKKYYQSSQANDFSMKGTGIGLALIKELLKPMKGKIDVESEVGQGSTFSIYLPITQTAEKEAVNFKSSHDMHQSADISALVDPEINPEMPIILLVEDHEDVASYIISCLTNFNVILANNGRKGREIAEAQIPDIIISDILMPEMNGYELCQHLKSNIKTDHIPVILLSAKAEEKDKILGFSYGADAYITKPFSKIELISRINQLLQSREKLLAKIKNQGIDSLIREKQQDPHLRFLQRAVQIIHKNLDNSIFGPAIFAKEMGMSESQLYKKLKAITGKSTALFIRSIRLEKAKIMLLSTNKSVSEVSYATGFNDPSWFSRAFRLEFGFSPSEVNNNKKQT
jgi:signal transduction histidine kinase/ligand-binding sensor domain-containing protein/CheY-like chemotaxis protein/AraC-like DNA-binding protein